MKTTLESFAPVAEEYRRCLRVAQISMATFVAITWGGVALGGLFPTIMSKHGTWIVVPAMICWFAALVSALAAQACLKCSECDASLQRAKGQYCPGCGRHALIDGGLWLARRCGKCGLKLHYGKGGRKFKVHHCSECGSHLHEKGL